MQVDDVLPKKIIKVLENIRKIIGKDIVAKDTLDYWSKHPTEYAYYELDSLRASS